MIGVRYSKRRRCQYCEYGTHMRKTEVLALSDFQRLVRGVVGTSHGPLYLDFVLGIADQHPTEPGSPKF